MEVKVVDVKIAPHRLEAAAEKLRVYDVDQGAWELEADGYRANAGHVLTHLSKDMAVKHFSNKRTVQEEIAPDSLQYALRLARWTEKEAGALMPTQTDIESLDREARLGNFRKLPLRQVAFLNAIAVLGISLHDEDHASSREKAAKDRDRSAAEAGRLLVYGAMLQAEEFEFDLFETFDNRLITLRERFGIPEPKDI